MVVATLENKTRAFQWNLGSSTDSGENHSYLSAAQSMIRDWVDFQLEKKKGLFFISEPIKLTSVENTTGSIVTQSMIKEWVDFQLENNEGLVCLSEPIKLFAVENTTGSAITISPFVMTMTSTNTSRRDMLILEYMVKSDDMKGFMQIIKQIDWQSCRERDLIKGIQLSLRIGMHSKASELSKIALSRFPDNPEIIKFADAFLPGRGKVTKHTADPAATADMNWLKTDGNNFHGKWVALKAGVLLASADTYKELKTKLSNPIEKTLLISKVI
jgi:hypothetical protein